jgi:hypothetical protein
MGTRQEMASSGPDFLRDSGPLPLQLLTGFKLKDGRRWAVNRQLQFNGLAVGTFPTIGATVEVFGTSGQEHLQRAMIPD